MQGQGLPSAPHLAVRLPVLYSPFLPARMVRLPLYSALICHRYHRYSQTRYGDWIRMDKYLAQAGLICYQCARNRLLGSRRSQRSYSLQQPPHSSTWRLEYPPACYPPFVWPSLVRWLAAGFPAFCLAWSCSALRCTPVSPTTISSSSAVLCSYRPSLASQTKLISLHMYSRAL
jgi:hypothetical protein